MSAPARRGLLAAVSALAVAPVAATAPPALRRFGVEWSGPIPPTSDGPHPDADLIAASANLIDHIIEYAAICAMDDGPARDARMSEVDKLEDVALDVLMDTPAHTPDGMAAKARAMLRWGLYREADDEQVACIGHGLARDLLAGDPVFLARFDADEEQETTRRRTLQEASEASLAAQPEPEPFRDDRTPQQKVDGARRVIGWAEKELREAEAEAAATGVALT